MNFLFQMDVEGQRSQTPSAKKTTVDLHRELTKANNIYEVYINVQAL